MAKSRTSGTEAPLASETSYAAPQAPTYTIERQGSQNVQVSRRWPQVHGGVCEFCGVLDPHTPSQYQYKLCPHFRGLDLHCSYCEDNKNPDDVVYHSNLNVAEHPDRPGKLVVWCDSYECSRKHLERFKISR